ncbi:Phosphoribosylglycinamide formyltransferase [Bathymodiolus heckerae thiotrophic gill symbiont]|nr:Phosphoribosylglycinamide formyltransferase (EC 2.1.2.2) [uncultured Gammaproteobacteria bacterium]SMN12633.1 Phosphoribosylglycinamide formyltransferase [Bathymodiolus heckerae thiotrophic gill symbiont]
MSSVVILISGSGSNLQSIINNADNIGIKIDCVISNKIDAFGLERAKNAGIATKVIDHTQFATREDFDQNLTQHINTFNPELIILAGFMRILSAKFIDAFAGKILNIHPALLPKFKGLNTHQRAIDAREKFAGASVHFVTNKLDSGEVILQKSVAIEANDDALKLAKKVLEQEHILYPKAIQKVLQR